MELLNLKGFKDLKKEVVAEATKEFNQLQSLEIFEHHDLCALLAKDVNFRISLNSDKGNLKTYVEYIQYRLHILKIIQDRSMGKSCLIKGATEWNMIKQVKQIYQDAMKACPEDTSLYVPFIKYCIRIDCKSDVVEWCLNFLRVDVTNENIWTILESLYFDDTNDVKSATWIILPAIGTKLITEIINEKVAENEVEDKRLHKLGDLFNMAFKHIQCSYFHISLLDAIKDDDIMKQVLNNFSQNIYMWNSVAQRIWRVDIKPEPGTEFDGVRSAKMRLEHAVEKYKEGISTLLPENKPGLWRIYINFLFFVYEDQENAISNSFKLNLLKTQLIEGMGYIQEKHLLKWLEMESNSSDCLQFCDMAVTLFPQSIKLWRERLKYEFLKDNFPNTRSLFNTASEILKENALPLWKDMIQYTVLSPGHDCLEEIFWEGCKLGLEISSTLRPMFLEWLILRKGIKHTRAVYNILCELEPHSKEMYVAMSKYEHDLVEDFDQNIAEGVHKVACSHFKDDMEVWLNYVKFLVGLSSRAISGILSRVRVVNNDAIANLAPHLHEEFKIKFDKLVKEK